MITGDERGMMKEALSKITDFLLGEDASTNLESFAENHPDIPDILSTLMTRPFFPGQKAVCLCDWDMGKIGEKEQKDFCSELEKGIPEGNYLIILSEFIKDKRKFFYGWSRKNAELLDFRKESNMGKSDLPAITKRYFDEKGFSAQPDAIMEIVSRCDFDYAKTIIESDKMMLFFANAKKAITKRDVQSMVVATNETLIFDFLDSIGSKNVAVSLNLLRRMLKNGEEHTKIIFLISKRIHSFLQFFDFMKMMKIGRVSAAMRYNDFKNRIYPLLGEFSQQYPSERSSLISGHPYYLYKMMISALSFSAESAGNAVEVLAAIDIELKTSALSKDLIAEKMIFSLVSL